MITENQKILRKITYFLKKKNKIMAMKIAMDNTGMNLAEARFLIDAVEKGEKIDLIIDPKKIDQKKLVESEHFYKIQRKLHEDFFDHLSPQAKKSLIKSEVIFFPQSKPILKKMLKMMDRIRKEEVKASFQYTKVAFSRDVLMAKKHLGMRFDKIQGYYYSFYPGSTPPFVNSYLNPIYKISFEPLRENFEQLWNLGTQRFGFVSLDFKRGFCCSNYVGYLPIAQYNPDEIVFEIFTWGI